LVDFVNQVSVMPKTTKPKTAVKPKYGWTWPLNMKQAHYFPENDPARSLCSKVLYLGSLYELGKDDSPDNCTQCKKKLLGGEATVTKSIPIMCVCKKCGRKSKSDYKKKMTFKWKDRKDIPKEIVEEVADCFVCYSSEIREEPIKEKKVEPVIEPVKYTCERCKDTGLTTTSVEFPVPCDCGCE